MNASLWDGAAWVQLGAALAGPPLASLSLALDASGAPLIAADVVDRTAGRLDTWVVRLAR